MTRKQWLHFPLVLLVLTTTPVGLLAAVVYRIEIQALSYLHRIYKPSRYKSNG